jgi:hypothetical protein
MMENSSGSQNFPSTAVLSGLKGAVEEDNVNNGEREEREKSSDCCNQIVGENSCEDSVKEVSGVDSCEASIAVGDASPAEGAEDKRDDEKESSVLDEAEKELLEEENTDLTENESSAEDLEKVDGIGDLDVAKCGENVDDQPSDAVEESQDTENFSASVDEKGSESADQGLPGERGSLNEETVMDVEVDNTEQEGSEKDIADLDTNEKEPSISDRPGKVTEDNLEENSSQDNEMSRNPSDSDVNPVAEEEMNMKVSDEAEGEHSVEGEDQEMQVESSEKNEGETEDVSMTSVGASGGENESMEVVSPTDQDPISMTSVSDADKGTDGCEQMEVSESTEENEMEGRIESDELKDTSKQTEETDDGTKQSAAEESVTNQRQGSEDDDTEKEKENQVAEQLDKPEGTESTDNEERSVDNKDEEPSSQKEKTVNTPEESGSGEVADEAKSSVDVAAADKSSTDIAAADKGSVDVAAADKSSADIAAADKNSMDVAAADKSSADVAAADKSSVDMLAADEEMNSAAGDMALNEASDKNKDKDKADEEVCIIPDTVLQAGGTGGDKLDAKEVQQNGDVNSEKPAAAEVVEKPKPSRKSSSGEKKGEGSHVATVEPVVEYRHSRPQRQAAKRAETQIKVRIKDMVKVFSFV